VGSFRTGAVSIWHLLALGFVRRRDERSIDSLFPSDALSQSPATAVASFVGQEATETALASFGAAASEPHSR
jgi:hypothetical protein